MRRGFILLTAAALTTILLAGCGGLSLSFGGLDTEPLEREIEAEIVSVLQTAAGRMAFAEVANPNAMPRGGGRCVGGRRLPLDAAGVPSMVGGCLAWWG